MSAAAGLHLTRTEENRAEIDALAELLAGSGTGGGRVGIRGVLADLPHRLRRAWLPGLLGRKVDRALAWEARDRRDPHWWPQGISTSARTGLDRDVLITSWYAQHGQGARVSVVDLERRRYRHVLLVEPTLVDGRPGIAPLEVHAGGLVWHGGRLHIAGTRRGFLTCHLDDLMRVPDRPPFDVHGYRYLLPVRFAYRADSDEGVERLRYSFLSLDRSVTPPALVVGEYGSSRQTRRLARVPIDDETGELATDQDGISRPLLDGEDGLLRMQGAAVAEGTYYVTASQGHWTPGTVHVGRPDSADGFVAHRFATPMGPEDLVWWPESDLLWSVSEHPRRRWIFAMRRSAFR
jgi:hypothetical protein